MLKNSDVNKCCFSGSSICFFAVLFAVSISSCLPADVETTLVNEWYVIGNQTPLTPSNLLGPVSIFRFYEAGKYSQFGADTYSFGRWRYYKSDSILHLHPYEGSSEILDSYYYLNDVADGDMRLTLYRNLPLKPANAELSLTMEAGTAHPGKYDPYLPELHTWRIKPSEPENDEQILTRTKNYLLFLKTLYRYAIRNKWESVPTNWYPHPLRMQYGNGIRMAYNDELSEWYECFYDTAQATKGYFYISDPLRDVTLTSTKNKFERNLDCIEQVLNKMK